MSASRRRRLDSIEGWDWDPLETSWLRHYQSFLNFVDQYDHGAVPDDYATPEGLNLGKWVGKQRTKKGHLLPHRKHLLDETGEWIWDAIQSRFNYGVRCFTEFFELNKHGVVPRGFEDEHGFKLSVWVSQRKSEYKAGILAPDKVSQLAMLDGWCWDTKDKAFSEALSRLSEFVADKGHSHVPHGFRCPDGFNLGQWCASKRQSFRNGSLSSRYAEALDNIAGWSWKPFVDRFQEGYAHLEVYVGEFGNARVIRSYVAPDNYHLGRWVGKQRTKFKAGRLSSEKISQFEKLDGWCWDAREADFQNSMDELRAYAKEYHHADVPTAFETKSGFKLGLWVSNRRVDYRNGNLMVDRVDGLEALEGWVWRKE